MTVAEALKRFRSEFHLSQKAVCETLDMMPQSYYRYETGRFLPQADAIIKLATTYNVSTDYLLGLSDVPQPPDTKALVEAINSCQQILGDALAARP